MDKPIAQNDSAIAEIQTSTFSTREKFIAGAFILVCGVFSWLAGGWLLALAANYMATGDNTPHQDFLTPMVYGLLFVGPIVIVGRL